MIGRRPSGVNATTRIRRSTLLAAEPGVADGHPSTTQEELMRIAFRVATLAALLVAAVTVASAHAQDRSKTKEVVVGLGAEPRTMLAVTIVDWTTNNMLEHIYDRLLDRDAKTFKPKPMLATEWKIVNDTQWEFKLRKGVKFHNGEPFTAASVKATIDYALDPATKSHFATAAYWGLVKEVQVVDDYTVRFVTKQPWPNLVDSASLTNSLMLPAKGLKELRSEERRVGKSVDLGGRRIIKKKKNREENRRE